VSKSKKESIPVFVGTTDIHKVGGGVYKMIAYFPLWGVEVPFVVVAGRSTNLQPGKPCKPSQRLAGYYGCMEDWSIPDKLDQHGWDAALILALAKKFHLAGRGKGKKK